MSGYDVDCCFVNPSEKGDYCCATVEDCCAEGLENCEYNTWRDQCDCGSSCDDSVVTSSCPSSSTTTSCPATHKECGDGCCSGSEKCCNNNHCCDLESDECCGNTCCNHIYETCCEGKCCEDAEEDCCFGTVCLDEKLNCCPGVAIYGEDTEAVELLRKYRDEVLNTTLVGRELIRLYYLHVESLHCQCNGGG